MQATGSLAAVTLLEPTASPTLAQESPAQVSPNESVELREALEKIRAEHELPGLQAGWVTGSGEFRMASCGVQKINTPDRPLASNSLMHLGSCTKSMTATLLAMYIEEGKFDWNSKLSSVFADATKFSSSDWGEATLEELMEHSSGLVANAPWGTWRKEPDLMVARDKVLTWLAKQPRKKEALNNYSYSNLGYMLMGHAMERIESKPWETIIRERLFEPLGMSSAGFGSPVRIADSTREASWGHVLESGKEDSKSESKEWRPIDSDNPAVLGPAGTVHATLEDWAKYLRIHLLQPGKGDFPLEISSQNWNRLHEARVSKEYAGGWVLLDRGWGKGRVYMHDGSNTMWYCVTFVAPEIQTAIFAASNCGLEASEGCDQALQRVLRLMKS